jgi:hypothetical protein
VVYWFVVAQKYGITLTGWTYTRGANVDPGLGKTQGTATFTCDSDHTICINNATAICTGPANAGTPFEAATPNPISSGASGTPSYGNFNTAATSAVDITSTLSGLTAGLSSYKYAFDGSQIGGLTCTPTDNIRPQLVATYNCIPKGNTCPST